jgi:hypothetical protein
MSTATAERGSREPSVQLRLLVCFTTAAAAAAGVADVCEAGGRLGLPLAQLSYLTPLGQQVERATCAHLRSRPARPPRQWDASLEGALGPSIASIQASLADEPSVHSKPAWQALGRWLSVAAEDTGALELKALLAPILEKMWVSTVMAGGVLGGIAPRHDTGPGALGSRTSVVSDLAARALSANKQAGRAQQAEQFYGLMHSYDEGPDNHPLRWFYDTDIYHASALPWPGLSVLDSPDPHSLLPAGTGQALLAALGGSSDDASSQPEDLPLYTAATGWAGDNCAKSATARSVCEILRGKMQTETSRPISQVVGRGIVTPDVEAVSLLRVKQGDVLRSLSLAHNAGSTQKQQKPPPPSPQQDLRVNVLAPLCDDGASVRVAGKQSATATTVAPYSLFALEDRADFEIETLGGAAADCVVLVVGVLHPDAVATLESEPFPSPQQVLRYSIDGANRSHTDPLLPWQDFSKTMTSALILASYYGYTGAVAALIEQGAPLDGLNLAGTAAVHAACLGITNVADRTQRHPDRIKKALEILELLAERGADLTMPGRDGTAEDLAKRLRIPELGAGIEALMAKLGVSSGGGKGGKGGGRKQKQKQKQKRSGRRKNSKEEL